MVVTLARENISSTGFMMIPPPMPQMAPAALARKLTIKNKINQITLSKEVRYGATHFCRHIASRRTLWVPHLEHIYYVP